MKLAKSACWLFSVSMLAAGGVYAQEAVSRPAGSSAKGAIEKPAKKKPVKTKQTAKEKAAALQAQREAEARASAEQEARQRAEAKARKQAEAEAEAKKQAELEAREKPLRDADELIKGGKSADAHALLEPLEFERAGEVRFDYLLGIAALDSGKPDKATLAFERVLAVDPNFAGARLDMARAYYQLGDLPRAKTEFEEVMQQNPPEGARVTIQKYLDAIAAHERSKRWRATGYIEGTIGHDSNVSSGTGSAIPVATLSPSLAAWITALTQDANPQIPPSKRSSNHFGVAGGVDVSRNLNTNWSIYAGIDLRARFNAQPLDVYDTGNIGGRVGVMYVNEQNAYRLTLTDGDTRSGRTMRTDSLGLSAEWQHALSPSDQVNTFVQFGQNRASGYQATDTATPKTDVRIEGDTDQVVAGAGWLHILADGKKALFGNISLGNEKDVAPPSPGRPNGGRIDGKKRFENLRIGGQAALTEHLDGFANLSWLHSNYDGANAFIASGTRSENQYDLVVGVNWHLDKLWTVKPQIAYSRRNSNLALYSFDRTDVSLTIRRDFK